MELTLKLGNKMSKEQQKEAYSGAGLEDCALEVAKSLAEFRREWTNWKRDEMRGWQTIARRFTDLKEATTCSNHSHRLETIDN